MNDKPLEQTPQPADLDRKLDIQQEGSDRHQIAPGRILSSHPSNIEPGQPQPKPEPTPKPLPEPEPEPESKPKQPPVR